MPPAGKPQPDPRLTREFVGWLETSLDQVAQDRPIPARSPCTA